MTEIPTTTCPLRNTTIHVSSEVRIYRRTCSKPVCAVRWNVRKESNPVRADESCLRSCSPANNQFRTKPAHHPSKRTTPLC